MKSCFAEQNLQMDINTDAWSCVGSQERLGKKDVQHICELFTGTISHQFQPLVSLKLLGHFMLYIYMTLRTKFNRNQIGSLQDMRS